MRQTSSIDAEQVNKAKKKARHGEYRERDDLRKVLNTEQGRRLLFWLMDRGRVFSSIRPSDADRDEALGRRALGLDLYHAIRRLDPALLPQMEAEYNAPSPMEEMEK